MSSACFVDALAACAARRWAEVSRGAGGCTDTVTFCFAAIAVSLVRSDSYLPITASASRAEDGQNRRALDQTATHPPSWWDDAFRSTAPAPQSKPAAHASRLVAQVALSVAFGPGITILAAGPAHLPLYSDGRGCGPRAQRSGRVVWVTANPSIPVSSYAGATAIAYRRPRDRWKAESAARGRCVL